MTTEVGAGMHEETAREWEKIRILCSIETENIRNGLSADTDTLYAGCVIQSNISSQFGGLDYHQSDTTKLSSLDQDTRTEGLSITGIVAIQSKLSHEMGT